MPQLTHPGFFAILFSVLLITSIGTVAATSQNSDYVTEPSQPFAKVSEPTELNRDVQNLSGLYWQGQELLITGFTPNEVYELYRIESNSDRFVAERTANNQGEIRQSTTRLSGRYYYQGPGVSKADSEFRVSVQTTTVRWEERTIRSGETTVLEVDSNRANYVVEVSADGLRFSDLVEIFDDDDFADNYDKHRRDHVILLKATDQTRLRADFSEIDPGTYSFLVEVTDTTASNQAELRHGVRRADASFDRTTVTEETGDVAEFTIRLQNTDTAYVIVGDEDVNVLDVIQVRDRNEDGIVRLRVNTRYVGLNPADPGVPSNIVVYETVRDGSQVYRGSSMLRDGRTLNQLRRDLDIAENGLAQPLRPGTYPVAVAATDDLGVSRNSLDIRDERAVASLELRDRSLNNIRTQVAPSGGANADSLNALRGKMTTRTDVALGDRLIIRTDVSGVFGHLVAEHDGNARAFIDNRAEGIDLVIEQTNPTANRDPIVISLDQRNVELVSDPENNHLYIVIDTRRVSTTRPLAAGQQYEATFTLRGVENSENRYNVKSSRSAAHRGYPYLRPGLQETVSTTFRLVTPRATVDGVTDNEYQVQADPAVRISGTTTLAPGTEIEVRHVSSGNNGFVRISPATVRSDGTWAVTSDFQIATVGQEFTTTVRIGSTVLAAAHGKIAPPPSPALEISRFTAPSSAASGEQFTVSVTVRNTGEAAGSTTVTYEFGGDVHDSREVTLGPGESQRIQFEMTVTEPGAYDHSASIPGDLASSEIRITESEPTSTPSPTPTTTATPSSSPKPTTAAPPPDDSDTRLPGFGIGLTLMALLVITLYLRRNA